MTASYVAVGIAIGSIYALAAMGLVLTYRTTGIFNFAHGTVAMIVAYLFWQMNEWGVPLWVAAFIAIGVVAPGIGILLERFVFRPLERARASTSTKLVATIGLFVLLLGITIAVWGSTSKIAPSLLPQSAVRITSDLVLGWDQIGVIIVAALLGAGLYAFLRFTHLGTMIRAVVDRRELAELMSVDSNRIAALGWAMGTTFAGLAGVLLAPLVLLEPLILGLLVIQAFSAAMVGRLVSLPLTFLGALLLGVGETLIIRFQPERGGILGTLRPSLSFVLFFGILAFARWREEEIGESTGPLIRASARQKDDRAIPRGARIGIVVLVLLAFALGPIELLYAHRALAVFAILLSLVVITGFSGHISLGQMAFAGAGAFAMAHLVRNGFPELPAIALGGLAPIPLALLIGFVALRRKGLFLGLATMAFGLLIFSFVFQSLVLAGGANGLRVSRPTLGGIDFSDDRAFYLLELAFVLVLAFLARNFRRGRLGRVLAAMRDSEVAARSIGINLVKYKLLVFSASAFAAGIGGALLGMASNQVSGLAFDPFTSLTLFTVAVVGGIASIGGAALGAAILVMFQVWIGPATTLLIGLGALFLGRFPNGLAGILRGGWERRRRRAPRLTMAPAPRPAARPAPAPAARPRLRPGVAAALRPGPAGRALPGAALPAVVARAAPPDGGRRVPSPLARSLLAAPRPRRAPR